MTTDKDNKITELLEGELTVEAISSLSKLGFDFPPTPPLEYRVMARCTVCSHTQYPYAINPQFELEGDTVMMVKCSVGSGGDFCDRCESKAAELLDDVDTPSCMTMELLGWGPAAQYEDVDGMTPDPVDDEVAK